MDVTVLRYGRGPFPDEEDRRSQGRLLWEILDRDPRAPAVPKDPWMPIAYFDPDGACVAHVEVAVLPMIGEGRSGLVSAVRCVAVAPLWRGHGLFKALLREALIWCESQSPATILYTAEAELYAPYGFATVAQHAFAVTMPNVGPSVHARRLNLDSPADRTVLIRRATQRTWLSTQAALAIDPATFLRNLNDPDLTIADAENLGAVLVYEIADGILLLHDVVSERMPRLDQVLGAIPARFAAVRTMFPPDQLGAAGVPQAEETGLMLRGPRPPGWVRPFAIAPTAEF